MDFNTINITSDMSTDRIHAAYIYTQIKHGGQERKFTGEPYFYHPLKVAITISNMFNKEYMIKAALMHDLIEDTDAISYDIKRMFGNKTAKLVSELTIDKKKREVFGGKKLYLTFLIDKMSGDAFTLKLADRLDNIKYLSEKGTPSDFIKWYVKETKYILDHLDRHPDNNQLNLITELNEELLKY